MRSDGLPQRRPGADVPPREPADLCTELAREQLDELRGRRRRERIELVTTGFDDFLGLLGNPPGGAVAETPTSIGLKVPTLPSSANACPYVFLTGVVDLDQGEHFVGFDQYLTIAAIRSSGEGSPPPPPVRLWEREVVSVGWHPDDVPPVAWYVTVESKQPTNPITNPAESWSFAYLDSDTPALVFRSAHVASPPKIPGYLGLDAYSAPQMLGSPIYAVQGMPHPMRRNSFCAMRYTPPTTVRVRVYALVWQTDPGARTFDTIPGLSPDQVEFASTSLDPEDSFSQVFPGLWAFRAVGCRLVVDKLTARRW